MKITLTLGSPGRLLMWFSRCCNLPTCSACLVVRLSKRRAAVYYMDFMALRITPLQYPVFGCEIKDAVKLSMRDCQACTYFFDSSLTHCLCLLAAPSTVSIMHQVSRTVDSITLSWSQPDQPNGVILDYELLCYEKVSHPSSKPSLITSFCPYPTKSIPPWW